MINPKWGYIAARLAFIILLAPNLMSCAAKLPQKSVAQFSNTELLLAYGQAVRQKGNAYATDELDGEIKSRRLLSAEEIIKIEDAKIYEGISSAAALASFGAPQLLGTKSELPEVQAWIYPYDIQHNGTLYIVAGKVVGYQIAPERDQNGNLKWARGGKTFPQNFQTRSCRPFADSQAITTACPDLDLGKRGQNS